MDTQDNTFKQLLQVDVSKYIDKKGPYNYLSWPFAVSQLRICDPHATWTVKRFDGLPYLQTSLGYFVEVEVTVGKVSLSQIHPVLDSRNKPIATPTPFDINTSIQRCLVKAIALHGLGLTVYAGEDLPVEPDETPGGSNVTPLNARDTPPGHDGLITLDQLQAMQSLIKETGTNTEALLAHFKVATLESIPATLVGTILQALEAKKRKAA